MPQIVLRRSRLILPLAFTAVMATAFLIHSPARENAFVSWDDNMYVTDNPRVQNLTRENVAWFFTHPYFRSYTPLTLVSHAVDYALWGEDPRGHHLHNVLLHTLNTGWIFLLGLLLITRTRYAASGQGQPGSISPLSAPDDSALLGAAMGALLFALHPLRVESVAWVSDRKDLLCGFFLLPSLISYTQYRISPDPWTRRRWYALSLGLFIPALLSKSIATTAPAVMIILDFVLDGSSAWKSRKWAVLTEKIPFLALSGVVSAAAIASLPGDAGEFQLARDMSNAQRYFLPSYSMTFYLGETFWPRNLAAVYDLPASETMAVYTLLMVLLTALFIVVARLFSPMALLTWLSYVFVVSPTVFFLSSGIQPIADRYTYLATPGFFLLAGGAIAHFWQTGKNERRLRLARIAIVALLIPVLAACVILSHRQIRIWQNSPSLWSHAITISPGVAAACNGLGAAMGQNKRTDEAIALFKEAVRLQPKYSLAWNNLGIVFLSRDEVTSAADCFRRAIECSPGYLGPYLALGAIAERAGKDADAWKYYRKARTIDPHSVVAHMGLARLFAAEGTTDSCVVSLQRALGEGAADPLTYVNAGTIYERIGDTTASIAAFSRAARFGNSDAQRELKEKGVRW